MFTHLRSKGFTLIELLVVIAIIGILASVVLVSLSSSRNRGSDASAMSSFNQARAAAEILYSSAFSYAGLCPTLSNGDPTAAGGTNSGTVAFYNALNNAHTTLGGGATSFTATGGVRCYANATGYATQIKLNDGYFCVDSSGFAGSRSLDMGATAVYTCPAS